MTEPIFTDFRRELIARTAADLLKILFAAALASKFFLELSAALRIGLSILSGILVAIVILGCPLRKPRE
jgi:hypothetical protein